MGGSVASSSSSIFVFSICQQVLSALGLQVAKSNG